MQTSSGSKRSFLGNKGSLKAPLWGVLIVPFILQIALVVGIVGYLSFRNSQRAVNDISAQLRSEITGRIQDHLRHFVSVPHQITEANATALELGMLDATDVAALQRYFWEQVQIYDTITSIYFGSPQGGIVGSGREGAQGALYIYYTDQLIKGDFEKYTVDSQGQPVQLLQTLPDFDATTRLWYTNALEKGTAAWNEPYILFTGQDMAIAASRPVYNQKGQLLGVISVDVFLSHLSNFLKDLEISQHGRSFIIDRDGLLVASSTDELPLRDLNGDGKLERLPASQSETPLIQHSASFLVQQFGSFAQIQAQQQLNFELDGKTQLMQVAPVQDIYGIDWLIVVVAPEADFMAHIAANNRVTILLITVALVMSLLVGIYTAQRVSKPITGLKVSTQALSRGEWQQPLHGHWIDEIDALVQAFNHMAAQLQHTLGSLTAEIAERKQAEQTLKESEERFRTLVQQMPVLVNAMSEDGAYIFWNQACEQVTGYSAAEITGSPQALHLFYPDQAQRENVLREWKERGNSFINWEIPLTCKDGSQKIIAWTNLSDLYPMPGWHSWAIGVDMTRQREADSRQRRLLAQVSEQAEQVREIIHAVPEGVLLLDSLGCLLMTNPAGQELLHYLKGDGLEAPLTELGGMPLADLLRPPARGIWHEIWHGERIFEAAARSITQQQGESRWVVILRDVTLERDAQRHVQQQARLAAVGQLAAGIAHDFNNILAVILLYTELSLTTLRLPPELKNRLQVIDQQSRRAAGLIQQILDFSRRAVIERRPMNLAGLLRAQVQFLDRPLPENIRITFECSADEYIDADPTRIQQAIMNLAVNARDAMPEGGQLALHLSRTAPDEAIECITCGRIAAHPWVHIAVSDSGHGISPEALPRIFDPFFTTKSPGQGTGLGLAQVYGIVKQHDGHLAVHTSPHSGAIFNLYFPPLYDAVPVPEGVENEVLLPGQQQTILVVEDEPAMQDVLMEAVTLLNYRAVCVSNGRQALEKLETDGSEIKLVLSDVIMPEMGGIALFRAIRQQGIHVPVIFITGHPMRDELEKLQAEGPVHWLLKPPTLKQLIELISQVLEA